MCGRFGLFTPLPILVPEFDIARVYVDDLPRRRYNVAPTHTILGIRNEVAGRALDAYAWGFKPSPSAPLLINARSETAHRLPAFRGPMRHGRIVVPADGFYEWKPTKAGKQPFWIHRRDGRRMALAGLANDRSAVILTTRPNHDMVPIHDRMPAILERDDVATWLSGDETNVEVARTFLKPLDDGILAVDAVSPRVNAVANDDAGLVKPLPRL